MLTIHVIPVTERGSRHEWSPVGTHKYENPKIGSAADQQRRLEATP